jgi:NAD(P)H-dependent flavin oxidoreductase YrpB (nitropropane dioxygenase family)
MATDPLHTRLCDDYGCEVPIVAFAHTKDVIAAVTNAGGIGVLGANSSSPDELESDIAWIRERVGDKPFGIDLLLPASFADGNQEDLESQIPQGHRDFMDNLAKENNIPEPKEGPPYGMGGEIMNKARQQLDTLLELKVPIFASGLGSPAFVMDQLHDVGTKVWSLVGLPRQAQRLVDADIDVIIAQGTDSGGHSGQIGTFSLVPQVVDVARQKDIPVLAAGGVGSGRHLAASLMLGAVGTWSGTVWQATNESETIMYSKEKILEAKVEDAIHSRSSSGKPIRQLRSAYNQAWTAEGAPDTLPMPLQGMLVAKFKQAVEDHNVEDWKITIGGQVVGMIDQIKPARQVVFDWTEEARDVFDAVEQPAAG